LITIGLAAASYAAIDHRGTSSLVIAVVAFAAVIAFILVERTVPHPMLPLSVFRSAQFTGANLVTFAVYAGFGGALFLVVLRLQTSLGYSALEAGAAIVPFSLLMLVLSRSAGRLAQRIGARGPMTVGPLVTAAAVALLASVAPGASYFSGVLPGVVLLGLGMSLTVAPLTAAVLAGVDEAMTGVASGINNAIARLAGLIAVAALPAVAGIDGTSGSLGSSLDAGYRTGLVVAAVVTAIGGVVAWAMVRQTASVAAIPHPSVDHACVS
jgi:hypothetical protein